VKTTSRVAAVSAGLGLSIIATVGFATAASAYTSTPTGPTGWTPNAAVHAIATSGNVTFVGGAFTGGVAEIDSSTGALITTANVGGDVRALAVSGSHLLIGGSFTTVDGATHKKLASLTIATGLPADPHWKAAAGGTVRDIVVNGNTEYFGGAFTHQNGQPQGGLGAVTVDTGKLVPSFTVSTDNAVFGLTASAGRLFVAGNFTHVGGAVRNSLASVTMATNTLDPWAPARACSICNQYWDVVVDNGTAFVGTSGNHLGAFYTSSPAGSPFHAVAANGDVQALAVSGGVLYAGGHFGTIANQTHAILAALNERTGAVDASFTPRFTTHYPGIWALSATSAKLYVGGAFTAAGPTPPKRYPYFAMFS
jgi:hypothetical protein